MVIIVYFDVFLIVEKYNVILLLVIVLVVFLDIMDFFVIGVCMCYLLFKLKYLKFCNVVSKLDFKLLGRFVLRFNFEL